MSSFPKYHKIHAPFMRDADGALTDEWARPEFEYLAGLPWDWTEKVDGTNIRIGLGNDELGLRQYQVGGRTERSQIQPALRAAIAALDLEPKLREAFDSEVTLYGEGYGGKIQTGKKYRETPSFVLFDIRVGKWWLQRKDVDRLAIDLGLEAVPLLGRMTLYQAIGSVRTDAIGSAWGAFLAEGLVGVPTVPMLARNGKRIIVKVKTRDFRPE